MTRIAISGPTDIAVGVLDAIIQDFKAQVRYGDTIFSGAAFGVDTAGARAAQLAGAKLTLIRPADLWHNDNLTEIADHVINVYGSYMERNDRLALEADRLVAYPLSAVEQLRSGTWATVRRFRKLGKPVEIRPIDSLEL